MITDAEARRELLERIRAKRATISAYIRDLEPRGARLTNTSIICGAVAAVLTAGPAYGGTRFSEGLQHVLLLPDDSIVWRILCFAAMVVSLVAAMSTTLYKTNDVAGRLSKAQACIVGLEGLESVIEFGHIPVDKAVHQYLQLIATIPFIPDMPRKVSAPGPDLAVAGIVVGIATIVTSVYLLIRLLPGASDGGGTPPTATPAPAQSPSVTPTQPLSTAFEDHFTGDRNPWPNNPQSTAWLVDGGYRMFARFPGQHVAVRAPLAGSFGDVILTARFRKLAGPPGDGYGLIVRDQDPTARDGINQSGRFYVLEADDRGDVGIWRREGNRWIDLVPWTPSAAVRPGTGVNKLSVRAIGSHLTLIVNDVEAVSVDDSVLPTGGVGVYVGGDFNQVLLDWFQVQTVRQ